MSYKPGEIATIHCDECICRNRSWVCDSKEEKGICTVYGEGNFITFDNKRYTMNGDCEYTLVQDYCDIDDLRNGTFKVISENIPCGTTGTSCSKSITVYVGDHKLILTDGHLEVLERSSDVEIPYKSKHMGSFLVIEMMNGIVLVWDRMTSIYIHLSTDFKGKVCGLCGNFDGNGNNDFTKRSQCVVEDVKEFRDSWKLSPECSDVYISKDPCVVNPYRMAWAQKLCNIILSDEFASCHKEVDPEIYYDACVRDTCACDVGGDCDCYCTAISAYAQACSEACVCIEWRSPSVCPLFCGFYNKEGECQWHYKPCGDPCMKTCSNPNGTCIYDLKGLEGCYPSCPDDKPYFNEDKMQCVAQCGCLDKEDNFYALGEEVESCNICESCICTITGILCHDDINACKCVYRGKSMKFGESIVVDEDLGNCTIVKCGLNGTMEYPCYGNPEITEVSTTALTTTTEQLVILTTPAKSSKRPTMSSVITTISSESTEITTGLESSSVVSETVSTLLTETSEETFISVTNSPKTGITEPIYTQRNDISYYNVLNESTFMTTTESPEKTPFSTISPGISTAISSPIALTAPYHIVSTTTLSSNVTKKVCCSFYVLNIVLYLKLLKSLSVMLFEIMSTTIFGLGLGTGLRIFGLERDLPEYPTHRSKKMILTG
ncbi:mucin-5B-like [Mixophyes fleayi]|uniref:mucin-5B-like n=1 Tax=Mixophyes fleayi TaxID=3061075 RepID=UPI003F4DE6A8